MAGADKLLRLFLPVVGAAEVGALGAVGNHFFVGSFHNPRGPLLGCDPPAVNATLLEAEFHRGTGCEVRNITGIHEGLLPFPPAGDKEICECGEGEGRRQDCIEGKDGLGIEAAPVDRIVGSDWVHGRSLDPSSMIGRHFLVTGRCFYKHITSLGQNADFWSKKPPQTPKLRYIEPGRKTF